MGAAVGFSPGKSAASRPREVPGRKCGSPHHRAEEVPRPSPPPVRPAAAGDRKESHIGRDMQGRGEAASGRRGDGAERNVAAKPAVASNAVAVAAAAEGGLVGSGGSAARESRASGGGLAWRKQRPESASRPAPKWSAVAREDRGPPGGGAEALRKRWPPESDPRPPLKRRAVSATPGCGSGVPPLAAGEGYSSLRSCKNEAVEASADRSSYQNKSGNTLLRRKGKIAAPAGRVTEDAGTVIKLGRAPLKKHKLKDSKASVESTILGHDDIMKQLAIRDGRVEWNHRVLDHLPPILVDARSAIRMICSTFHSISKFITRAKEQGSLNVGRVDFEANKVIRELQGVVRHDPIVGNVPGVEVGDEFFYKIELALVGLHLPPQGGIGFTKDANGVSIAVSVIASRRYPDDTSAPDEIEFFGSGGKPAGKKADEDQKLQRGNLALRNCIQTKTPVRVIHGVNGQDTDESSYNHSRAKPIYTYGGLYLVEKFWRSDLSGSRVFKYLLKRIPGQPKLTAYKAGRLRKSLVRPGLYHDDISQGKENIPVVSDADGAHPTPPHLCGQ